jgi:hypothetical protein
MNLFASFLFFFLMTGWMEPSPKVKRAQLGREFTLHAGEQVLIKEADLKISFSQVGEDSRCPTGVKCIWAGNGKVVLKVSRGDAKAVEVELNTNVEPKQYRFQDYDIKLSGLNPYPHKDVAIKRGQYVATLLVSK